MYGRAVTERNIDFNRRNPILVDVARLPPELKQIIFAHYRRQVRARRNLRILSRSRVVPRAHPVAKKARMYRRWTKRGWAKGK